MGGSGGSSFSRSSDALRQQVDEMLAREKERLQSDVGNYLAGLLATFNDRNVEQDRERLEGLRACIGEDVGIEALLLGGSVAKHTAVDGISDVDAIVLLDRAELQNKTPSQVLEALRAILHAGLHRGEVVSISRGGMAVTIQYNDGREIQILPAVRVGKNLKISDATGKAWKEIAPKQFERSLTNANAATNNSLVPAIKLMKAVNDSLPAPKKMTGYHIEALAVDAVKEYTGPKTVKAVFEHILTHATSRVMQPIADVTGQSRTVDDYLGPANAPQRQNISQAMASVRRRLGAATSVADWKSILEG